MLSRRQLFPLAGLAGITAFAGRAHAHHGWGGYDVDKAFTITGPIVSATYENPHCEAMVRGADGKVWRLTLAPPFRMQNRGVTADMLKPGTVCTSFAYPNKHEAGEARVERMTIDGKNFELR